MPRAIHLRKQLETLEERVVPATITWANPIGGSWQTAGNWDLNRVPAATDDVVIPDVGTTGANVAITYNTGSTTVNSIDCAEMLSVNGGTLTDAGNLSGTGSTNLAGGTFIFAGANWTNTSTLNITSGTINLGGSFATTDIGTLNRTNGTAGTVNLTGTMTNTGATLTLDAANNGYGTWTLAGIFRQYL